MNSFPIILIHSASLVLIASVIIYAWRKRTNAGALQLCLAAAFMFLWAVSSFAEVLADSFAAKLMWRNITQVGVFYAPAACLTFSVTYSGMLNNIKKPLLIFVFAVQTMSILLIFTDPWLHLMRESVQLLSSGGVNVVTVTSTWLGRMLVSANFIIMAAALAILIVFAVKTNNKMRTQVLITMTGMAIAVVYALIKVTSGERILPFLPISAMFGLASLAMLLGIFQYDFLMVLPIARNEAFNVIGDGILVASPLGEVIDANAAGCRMLSHLCSVHCTGGPECLSGINRLLADHYPEWRGLLAQCQAGSFQLSETLNGDIYHLQCDTYVLSKKRNKAIGTISVLRDVTEQRRQNELLKLRAERDGLLGIYNRHTFIDLVNQALARNDRDVCLIFFDLDDFKKINDSFGHIAGDYVLKEVCGCVAEKLSEQHLLGRIGGEEFAIFISGISPDEALKTAETLRSNIERHTFEYQEQLLHVTVSIGLATGRGKSFNQLYQCADDMLYKAKDAGKNCIMI